MVKKWLKDSRYCVKIKGTVLPILNMHTHWVWGCGQKRLKFCHHVQMGCPHKYKCTIKCTIYIHTQGQKCLYLFINMFLQSIGTLREVQFNTHTERESEFILPRLHFCLSPPGRQVDTVRAARRFLWTVLWRSWMLLRHVSIKTHTKSSRTTALKTT